MVVEISRTKSLPHTLTEVEIFRSTACEHTHAQGEGAIDFKHRMIENLGHHLSALNMYKRTG